MRTMLRGVAVWCCIIIVETLHGIARTMFLAPALGDFQARQVAVFTGSFLILVVAIVLIRWIRPADAGEAVRVGMLWLVLTLVFEIAFGRYVLHAPWSRIASDYNVLRGGLLPIGLLVLTAAPLTAIDFFDRYKGKGPARQMTQRLVHHIVQRASEFSDARFMSCESGP